MRSLNDLGLNVGLGFGFMVAGALIAACGSNGNGAAKVMDCWR